MKKTICFLFLAAFFQLGFSQNFGLESKWSFSVQVEARASRQTGVPVESKTSLSPGARIWVTRKTGDQWNVETGIGYDHYAYGSSLRLMDIDANDIGTVPVRFNYTYLSVPLGLELNSEPFLFRFGFKGHFNIDAFGRTREEIGMSLFPSGAWSYPLQYAKPFVPGAYFQAGYSIPLGETAEWRFGVNLQSLLGPVKEDGFVWPEFLGPDGQDLILFPDLYPVITDSNVLFYSFGIFTELKL
jgi:hypothetical protein